MALSDYLTGKEWNACFYAQMGKSKAANFGESMRFTIDKLLENGYKFSGLDENGSKVQQVENGINAEKITIFFGNTNNIDVKEILNTGREFMKQHCVDLVNETDDEWSDIMDQL